MKKLFTLIVAICATTLAWADYSGSCGENVTYSFVESTGTLTISGTGDMKNYVYSYSRPWDFYSSYIKKVVINNGVTSIGEGAFRDCTGLTSVTIPNSVTSIESSAFSGTAWYNNQPNGLVYAGNVAYKYKGTMPDNTSVTIKEGTVGITDYAFSGCTGLTSITIPNSVTSIGAGAFSGTAWYDNQPDGLVYAGNFAYKYKGTMPDNTSITIKEGTVGIAGSAFRNCTGLTSVTIPNSVTSIEDSAFEGCTGLTSVTIGNGVTSIGYNAFYGCDNIETADINSQAALDAIDNYFNDKLTSIILGDDITSIGGGAFYGCEGLTSITIGNGVTSIGYQAFSGCTGLTSITIPNSVTSIGYNAFDGTAWYNNQPNGLVYAGNFAYDYKGTMPDNTSVTIKEGTVGITGYAFSGCTGLTSVTIPNSVTSIGYNAFYGCTGLTSVTIPNSVTEIEGSAFSGCTGLTSVTIPNSVTSIRYQTFSSCTGLTSVTIPNSVTSIEVQAFKGCEGLRSVTIPNSVTSIGWDAFDDVKHITYTGGATGSPWGAKIVNGFVDGDFVFSDNTKTQLVAYVGNGGSVIIPDGVTSIGEEAFYNCTGLTSVTIPNSVTSIGWGAFDGTAWYNNQPDGLVYAGNVAYKYKGTMPDNTSVTIKEGTVGITPGAFAGCTGLTSVTIPNSFTSIGEGAFYDCTGLTSITIPNSVTSIGDYAFEGSGLTSITIPNSVTSIGDYAFEGSGLTSVTIPNSVTSIGEGAFYDCTGLRIVTIGNGVTSIGEYAFGGCEGLRSMTVEATNPPLCVNEYGDGLAMPNYNIPLYVPAGSVNAYIAADEWWKFTIILAISNSGVNEATVENTVKKSEVKKIIDRNGIIYIEKDGTRYFLNGSKVK